MYARSSLDILHHPGQYISCALWLEWVLKLSVEGDDGFWGGDSSGIQERTFLNIQNVVCRIASNIDCQVWKSVQIWGGGGAISPNRGSENATLIDASGGCIPCPFCLVSSPAVWDNSSVKVAPCFVAVSWKTERPLKYETMRPVSAAISVKHRPPTAQRKVQSAAIRCPQRSDLLTSNRPDMTADQLTGHRLTTTPENSDVDDDGKNGHKVDAWKSRGSERTEQHEDPKKNTKRNKPRMRVPKCVDGLEEDVERTRVMEDKFKQQMIQLQQQLRLTTQGYVWPPKATFDHPRLRLTTHGYVLPSWLDLIGLLSLLQ